MSLSKGSGKDDGDSNGNGAMERFGADTINVNAVLLLREFANQLQHNTQQLQHNEQVIKELTEKLEQRDHQLEHNTQQLQHNEQVIKEQTERLDQRDHQLEKNNALIENYRVEFITLKTELMHHRDIQEKLYSEFEKICNKLALAITAWSNNRCSLVSMLFDLANDLEEKKNDTNIADLTGGVVGAVGSGISIAGLVLIPFTAGISSILMFTGLGVGLAGGATSVGAGITDIVIGKIKMSEVNTLMETDNNLATQMLKIEAERAKSAENLVKKKEKYDNCLRELKERYPVEYENWINQIQSIQDRWRTTNVNIPSTLKVASTTCETTAIATSGALAPAASVVTQGVKAAIDAGADVAPKAGALAATGAKVMYGFGWAGAGVGTALSLRTIIAKSRSIHRFRNKEENIESNVPEEENMGISTRMKELFIGGNTISEQADKVRQLARALKQELIDMMDNQITKEVMERYVNHTTEVRDPTPNQLPDEGVEQTRNDDETNAMDEGGERTEATNGEVDVGESIETTT